MVNIISTTTPTANGPRAMTLQALKQRQAELELQQQAISKPHEVTSIPQGIGDIANAFFTARRGAYLENKEAQTRDTLAKLRAGWGPEGPTQQQAAEYSQYDPEFGNKISEDVMKAAQDKAAQDRLFGFNRGENEANRGVTTRGQDLTAEGVRRGQDITQEGNQLQSADTRRGQDVTAAGNALQSADTRRGQDVTAEGNQLQSADTRRGQDVTQAGNVLQSEDTRRGQDATAQTAANKITADQDAAKLLADAKVAEPNSADGKIYSDWKNGKFGVDPNSPAAMKALTDALTAEHVKGTPPTVPAEVGARVELGRKFQERYNGGLRTAVSGGGLAGVYDQGMAKMGYGDQGTLQRQIEEGADALLRQLTGQGMTKEEAKKYSDRYVPGLFDTAASATEKIDQLNEALSATEAGSTAGRQWIKAKMGVDLNGRPVPADDPAAVNPAAPAAPASTVAPDPRQFPITRRGG